MLFDPSTFICSRISCSAPLPMASIAITDATPKRMPSDVRLARSLLCTTASAAMPPLKRMCVASARARDGAGAPGSSATAVTGSALRLRRWCRRGSDRWRGSSRLRESAGRRYRGSAYPHALRRVATRAWRGERLQPIDLLDLDVGLVRRRDEEDTIVLVESTAHDDLIVVRDAGLDHLLH